jgi:hypothetical protein
VLSGARIMQHFCKLGMIASLAGWAFGSDWCLVMGFTPWLAV